MKLHPIQTSQRRGLLLTATGFASLAALLSILALAGCGATPAQKANANFFTSGSREADQRASQRMAQAEQLAGSGEGAGEKGVTKAKVVKSGQGAAGAASAGETNRAAKAKGKLSLFEQLGGEAGISNIVVDFLPRAMNDPRVNWDRKGVKRGGFSLHAGKSETWKATPQNVAILKRHFIQFLALATGGPASYTGGEIQSTHAHMHISNAEFDAAIGDLKASLDKLQIPNLQQKELLAIIESTRPQIVTER
jgi:hemoglobin